MARFAVITTRLGWMRSRNWSPIQPISCASSRSKSADWFRSRRATFVANHLQIIAVIALGQPVDNLGQIFFVNETHPQRDFFKACHFESLSMFDGCDVVARFQQTRLSSGVEPGHPAAEQLHMQFIFLEIK